MKAAHAMGNPKQISYQQLHVCPPDMFILNYNAALWLAGQFWILKWLKREQDKMDNDNVCEQILWEFSVQERSGEV